MELSVAEVRYPSSLCDKGKYDNPPLISILNRVKEQVNHARWKHPPIGSVYDAYSIIREEMEEFFDSIKKNDPDIKELYQVIACCLMAIEDVYGCPSEFVFNPYTNSGKAKIIGANAPSIYRIYGVGQYYFDLFWSDVMSSQGDHLLISDLSCMAQSIFDGLVYLLSDIRGSITDFYPLSVEWRYRFHLDNL